MSWLWIGLSVLLGMVALLIVGWTSFFYYIKWSFFEKLLRIFQEKPLFIIPRGKPVDDAEDITLHTPDGLKLIGCYLKTRQPRRKGVILFGLEFGSNRWACVPYCEFLRDAGFDIFTFEYRNQGDSDYLKGYDPLQWVTSYEVEDFRAALDYLKSRPDADPRGVGLFGISKGAGAGVLASVKDDYVRCFVTDGMFATHTTMVPYMRKWIAIYSTRIRIQRIIPTWYYAWFAHLGLRQIEKDRHCHFPHLERNIQRLSPRPLLMIHGGGDTYIKPEMARALFDRAGQPKEFWLVDKAKHNQSFHLAHEEYKKRVLEFFLTHLAGGYDSEEGKPKGLSVKRSEKAPATAHKN